MAKFIVPDNYDKKNWVRQLSEIITRSEANSMITRYGGAYNFPFDAIDYFPYLTQLTSVADEQEANEILGLAMWPGKENPANRYPNLALVPLIYKRSSPNGPITEHRYPNAFYGRLNPKFNKPYDGISGRTSLENATRIKDDGSNPRTEIIVIEYNVLEEFSGNQSDYGDKGYVRIDFARNRRNRLTTILSRRLQNGDEIQSTVSGHVGIFLDDNDLLP